MPLSTVCTPGRLPAETERPRGHAHLRLALLETGDDGARHVGEPAAQQRFHDDGGNVPFAQFAVKIFGVGIPRIDPLGVFPVQIVQLDLHEIPLVFVVPREQMVEHPDIAVIRESEVADAPRPAFLQQEIEDAVLHVAALELLHAAAHAHAVQQQIVYVIHLQLFQRIAVHGDGGFAAPRGRSEVGEFGGDEVLVARVTAQGDAGGAFRLAPAVGGRRVEIVHSVGCGIVHQFVHHLLIYLLVPFTGAAAADGGQTHHAESQQRHFVARRRVGPVCHPVRRDLRGGCRRCPVVPASRAGRQSGRGHAGGSYRFQKLPAGQHVPVFILVVHLLVA